MIRAPEIQSCWAFLSIAITSQTTLNASVKLEVSVPDLTTMKFNTATTYQVGTHTIIVEVKDALTGKTS